MNRALITGITGQDGSYLTEFLLERGYEVHGIIRRGSSYNTGRIDHLYKDPHLKSNLRLHYGDLSDASSLRRVLSEVRPTEVYNLGAQSHVKVSFDIPEYTADVDALGTLRLLEAVRDTDKCIRFYQASSSEMFGKVTETPQTEQTPFHPRSPYGVSKLFAHWAAINYREAYGMFVCCGILFNHESPRRGENFVTRKITKGLVNIKAGVQDYLYLGNLDAVRDWGHARDYVEAQWLMMQAREPRDYVIASGRQRSVRDFVAATATVLGMDLNWDTSGESEVGYLNGEACIYVDPAYYRPTEVDTLMGDPSKAITELGWWPRTSFDELVAEMVAHDIKELS